ncbi:MAG: carboxylating nicotinate-nucleotide diphosphorylase [Acidobacteriota bacterium]|nr:carboxylating nicotinate-nucleotide diphosphorylase [Acidobacteriota bacterium]
MIVNKEIDRIISFALKEDMPKGDITSESIIPPDSMSKAILLAKQEGILAGIEVARRVFFKVDKSINFEKILDDGAKMKRGDRLATIEGRSISLLKGERTALNFLQRMSGIATKTNMFVRVLEGTKTKVLDTRKTTPGIRILEKYSVKVGGGENHRLNLSDMVLIKDNHLQIVGSITEAIQRARKNIKTAVKIEVETTNLEEVKEAVIAGADLIMLDNMDIESIKKVVAWVGGRVPLEVSGNVDLNNAHDLAEVGVDYISVGGLTHSVKALDISMEFIG